MSSTAYLSDLGRLVEWGETRHHDTPGPFGARDAALILHPFSTPRGETVRWHQVAAATGVDLGARLRAAPPSPRALCETFTRVELEPPIEGYVPRPARPILRQVLGDLLDGRVCVGLYGGWGQPEGIETEPVPATGMGLSFWLAHADGAAFFASWAAAEESAETRRWEDLVTFVWPEDQGWLLYTDPDDSHSELYADAATITRLEASPLETARRPTAGLVRA